MSFGSKLALPLAATPVRWWELPVEGLLLELEVYQNEAYFGASVPKGMVRVLTQRLDGKFI